MRVLELFREQGSPKPLTMDMVREGHAFAFV